MNQPFSTYSTEVPTSVLEGKKTLSSPLPLPPRIPSHIVAEIESDSPFVPKSNLYLAILVAIFFLNLVFSFLIWLKV